MADTKSTSAQRDQQMDEQLLRNYDDPEKQAKRKKNVKRGFCITLVLLVLSSIINWGVISSWGRVDIERVYTTGANGAEWSALVYRPKEALDAAPAPGIIMFHGSAGNARNHESWAVEFARRGFVVVTVDLDGSGDALYTTTVKNQQADYWFQYLMNLSFVDKNHIITSGHSAGCTPAADLGAKYDVEGIIIAGGVSFFNGHYGTLPGVFDPTGGQANTTEGYKIDDFNKEWFEWNGKFAICMGYAEMKNYSTDGTWESFVNGGGSAILRKYEGCEDAQTVEVNKVYGDFDSDSAFVFCAEDYRIHEGAFVSKNTIGNLLEYGQKIVGGAVPNYIDSTNQVWMYKDYTGLLGVHTFAAFLIALVMLLLEEVPVFGSLRWKPVRNVGLRGIGLAIDIVIAVVAPYIILKTDLFGLIGKQGSNMRKLGANLRYANISMGIIIGMCMFAILGFCIFWFTDGRKKNISFRDLGLFGGGYDELTTGRQKARFLGKTVLTSLLIAAIVVGVGYAYIQFQLDVAGTDFYAWFFGVKNIVISKIPAFVPFIITYCLCYIPITISLNVVRRLPSTGNDTKDLLLNMLVNGLLSTAVIILMIAMKWHLQSTGNWAADGNWFWNTALDVQRIFGLPTGMFIASSSATFLYRKTNNVWLTAMVIGLMVSMMCVGYGQYQVDYLISPVLK